MRIRHWSGALAAILLVAGVAVSAHLKVEKTFPETDATVTSIPDHLQVWFSQAPTVPVSSLTLEGPDGKVTMGKAVAGKVDGKSDKSIVAPVTGTITAGKYTVTWKTSGSDGHIQTGTFDFIVKPGV
jgi:methionine-rich copper-binding protein CopC